MKYILRIAICEDLTDDAVRLKGFIDESGVLSEVSLFESGEVFLAASPFGRFHLVFMDIYMSGMTGVEAAHAFRETDKRCEIVFTTTSLDHALDSYSVDAMQYLVKPDYSGKEHLTNKLDQKNITKILNKVIRSLQETAAEVCTIVVGGQRRDIPLQDILYAEVFNKACHVHISEEAGTETLITAMTIDELAAMLPPPRFLRSHRANIVNLDYVKKVERDFIMKNGKTVYIRHRDLAKCKQEHERYQKNKNQRLLSEAGRYDE